MNEHETNPDQPPVGVIANGGRPGVTPVAFVAFVQYVDESGALRVARIDSDGLVPERATAILAAGQ